ncbi:uncharacterized protein BX663DRAFT_539262 [Cokeromyces recurvatus]|uniref:uncharacterized protein n=1 Tax=Cokeromyces recurvatus TaxID=90255 RepID=UPI0022212A48|nr:uncharacterized protein BX663DRAFT_539262 [Cokeromyces recurvatus]KAI7907843.1 hypothetical protein BX663DRAFT_539262 [Cokeromyces recurvatus]
MRIQKIVIGEYQISPAISFCLYQLPSPIVTPPISQTKDQQFINYYCLEDLFSIFDLQLASQDIINTFLQSPSLFFKDLSGRSYIQARAMADIASKHQIYNLADLCCLEDDELLDGGAIPLLKMTTFVRLLNKPICHVNQVHFEPRRLDGTEWFLKQNKNLDHKLETASSPTLPAFICPPATSTNSPPLLLPSTPSSSPSLSSMSPPNKRQTAIELPKPSTLLLKRLAPKHGTKKNLTILTPSYNEKSNQGLIQSAPLRRTTIPPNHHPISHKVSKGGHITKKPYFSSNDPATTSATVPSPYSTHRFPNPPIVPSQQPAWHQYRPSRSTTKTPPVMTQKQKFLQPFEFLYDQIEQTKHLKHNLDDQIRRSSNLMQTLQQGNYVETLVRRQVRDIVSKQFEKQLLECTERLSRLEQRIVGNKLEDMLTQVSNRIQQLESKLS